jgi:hypothetical protein
MSDDTHTQSPCVSPSGKRVAVRATRRARRNPDYGAACASSRIPPAPLTTYWTYLLDLPTGPYLLDLHTGPTYWTYLLDLPTGTYLLDLPTGPTYWTYLLNLTYLTYLLDLLTGTTYRNCLLELPTGTA